MRARKLRPRDVAPLLFLVLVSLLGVPAAPAADLQANRDVVVCVFDERGSPVFGATVVIVGSLFGEVVDESGCVRFEGVPTGRHVVRISATGFVSADVDVVVGVPREELVTVTLRRLFDSSTGGSDLPDPFAPATVQASSFVRRINASAWRSGHLALARQDRSGLFGSGSRATVSDPVRTLPEGAPDAAIATDPSGPVVEIGISSNTGHAFVAGRQAIEARSSSLGLLAYASSAGGYRDGSGDEVSTRYRAYRLEASGRYDRGLTRYAAHASALGLRDAFGTGAARYETATGGSAAVNAQRLLAGGAARASISVAADWTSSRFESGFGYKTAAGSIAARYVRKLGSSVVVGAGLDGSVSRAASRYDSEVVGDAREPGALVDRAATATLAARVNSGPLSIAFVPGVRIVSGDSGAPSPGGFLVLPTGKVVFAFDNDAQTVSLSFRHDQWESGYAFRAVGDVLVWHAQGASVSSSSGDVRRGRATSARILFAHRGKDVVAYVSATGEALHDLPVARIVDTEPTRSEVEATQGWSTSAVAGLTRRLVGPIRLGFAASLLRARDTASDEALAGVPSSVIAGFAEIAPAAGTPYMRVTTAGSLRRERTSLSTLEAPTPSGIDTSIELGFSARRVRIVAGVSNLGDRVVRDHLYQRTLSGEAVNEPGRRWYVRIGLR